MDVREAMALSVLGLITSKELVEAGTKALASGIDSPTVCRLAGLVPCEHDQAKGLFESFVQECGLGEIDLREAAIISTWPIAEKLARGLVRPRDAAYSFQMICSAAEYPEELLPLGLLFDEYKWDEPRSQSEIDSDVVIEAARFVATFGE